MYSIVKWSFFEGQDTSILTLPEGTNYSAALTALKLEGPCPTLVIIGGASFMDPYSQEQLTRLFNEVLAPMAKTLGITVLDGGTDAGVIHLMGQARRHGLGGFRLVGVAPQGKVKLPGPELSGEPTLESPFDVSRALQSLEPNHTHFFLIPGDRWGCESIWLAQFASVLAGQQPSLTLLVNGGKIALVDLQTNLSMGRKVVVLSGSGRLADEVAGTLDGSAPSSNQKILSLVHAYSSHQIRVLDLSSSLESLTDYLHQHFTPHV